MLTENLFTVRSGAGLVLAVSAIVLLGVLPILRKFRGPRLRAVAVGLLLFQVFHFLEHLIQLTYWFFNSNAMPYMTPWAMTGADGLGLWATLLPGDGTMMLRGMELLHLIGNSLFLGGIIALQHLVQRGSTTQHLPGLRAAKTIQTAHVAEHVLLTASVFLVGEPLGASTLFGFAEGASWGPSLRVWFHFLINLAATVPAVRALIAFRSQTSCVATERRDGASILIG